MAGKQVVTNCHVYCYVDKCQTHFAKLTLVASTVRALFDLIRFH